jgi:superfamily I DNA/RNA helicase
MVWLHPEQAAAVRRTFDGPARIRGVAGTGKTVVGLHRTAWLESTRPGRFLVTSFVNTLPQALEHAYRRLSPTTADRVDFRTVHKVALDLLAERGRAVRLDTGHAAFNAAWRRAGSAAEQRGLTKDYVEEEIEYVVRGRGIDTFDGYVAVDRPGRGARLGAEQRRAVWGVATAYEEELAERGVCDFVGALRLARDAAREERCRTWSGVMVDEVQDIPLVALQLLHELAGRDRPDGLLLIGDGQQAIYPGGFRLAEAGIDLRNRAVVLRTNYRNTVEILATAHNVRVEDVFEGDAGGGAVEVVRHGDVPMDVTFGSAGEHDDALVWDLRALLDKGAAPRGIAVLCPTNAIVETYVRRLTAEGIPAAAVTKRSGVAMNDTVSVATWHRSKGLEFAHVFIARAERASEGEASDDAERVARDRRTLYVAMTRARNTLWVGRVARARDIG